MTGVFRVAGLSLVVLGLSGTARAAELTAFVSGATPEEAWGRGYGAMLSISLLDMVHADIEGAWQGSDLADTRMLSASAKAYVGPSLGRLVPYVGIGAGVYRQSGPSLDDDSGRLGLLFVGAKLHFPVGLVIRGEYQWADVPDDAALPFDNRLLLAAGLRF
jgi:hypothetical protein